MRHLPVFVDTRDRRVVISGGGDPAIAKLRVLMKTEARLEVYAREPHPILIQWQDRGHIEVHERPLLEGDLEAGQICLVYAANAHGAEDARVVALAEARNLPVNVVDDLEQSRFISPALVDRDPVVVAIGTEGSAPVLARRIKSQIEALLAPNLGQLARLAAKLRPAALIFTNPERRRAFWSRFFTGSGEDYLKRFGEKGAELELRQELNRVCAPPPSEGRIVLVGAGPGDPELLTHRARREIESADVVLYDRLVDPRIMDLARREALLLEVGKTPGGPAWSQDAINEQMVTHALAGKTVVRLKSGDPMIFGRADEELDALGTAGIPFEVVPGITAASAAASRIATSLTRRGRNHAITFLTAQGANGYAEQDWRAMARPDAVFGIYMGVGAARFVQGRLLLHGRPKDTWVTVVANISRKDERVLWGTLGELDTLVGALSKRTPAIIFVGLSPRSEIGVSEPVPTLFHEPKLHEPRQSSLGAG